MLMSSFTEQSPSLRPLMSDVIPTVGMADLLMISGRLKKREKIKQIWKR